MGNVSRLRGTPWHVEPMYRKEGDERRHRSRCINYCKLEKCCNIYSERCRGAAHCSKYEEKIKESEKKLLQTKEVPKEKRYKIVHLGDVYQHKIYGRGVVIEIKNDIVTIAFNDNSKKFKNPESFEQNFII